MVRKRINNKTYFVPEKWTTIHHAKGTMTKGSTSTDGKWKYGENILVDNVEIYPLEKKISVGDLLYCDVTIANMLFKIYEKDICEVIKIDGAIIILKHTTRKTNFLAFGSDPTIIIDLSPYLWDHFVDIKRIRKNKLENLSKKPKSL